jgi:hypothetical protein
MEHQVMANPKHLKILKQGVVVWNQWRSEHPLILPELSGADLNEAELSEANLSGAILNMAILIEANLIEANLSHAILSATVLSRSNFKNTYLGHANIEGAIFAANDLGTVEGMENVIHLGPSSIGFDTVQKSDGHIPDAFLRGCGLSDWLIESVKLYQPELSNEEITDILYRIHDLRAHQAIQINPLFISYNHTDGPFVDEMEDYLNKKGIRFWRDIHHAVAGRLEKQVDRAIRLNPTVLLVLSDDSTRSDWVEHEVRLARKLEQETGRDVLCPVALDDKWKECKWPKRLREQIMEYNILDFSNWKDKANFHHMFSRLIEGLDLFYANQE